MDDLKKEINDKLEDSIVKLDDLDVLESIVTPGYGYGCDCN